MNVIMYREHTNDIKILLNWKWDPETIVFSKYLYI